MPSSRPGAALAVVLLLASGSARAQTAGFAVERLYPSAPGAGWVVMDALDMHGGLGGAISLTLDYARDPLVVSGVPLVAYEATAEIGAAVTYDRFRFSLNLDSPLALGGQPVAGWQPPALTLGSSPDTISDVRLGFDARVLGEAHDAFRLGLSAQLYVPSGDPSDYVSDGTVRAIGRVLVAGDVGRWAYAAQLGIQLRPRADVAAGQVVGFVPTSPPGGPAGSELLFGVALGPRIAVVAPSAMSLIIGPEVFGETALQAFGGTDTTGVEALLSARLEGNADDREQLRLKLGAGVGLDPHFGAPAWRLVFSAEGFDFDVVGPR